MKRIHSVFSFIVCFCMAIWAVPLWAAFVDNGNGTVSDTSTGLTWQQDTPDDVVNWEQALAYCESLALGGATDWRLPTIKELRSLVDFSRNNPAIDITRFPNTLPSFYWSSTTYATTTSSAWGVFFLNGSGSSSNKASITRVRAVRGGQSASSSPLPDIKVNGQDGPVTISSIAPVSITASLAAGDQNGMSADWWLVAGAFGNLYSVTATGWAPGINSLFQYPLFTVSPVEIYSGFLPAGDYVFCFGVDMNPNGMLDVPLFYDCAQIHVIN